MAWEVNDFKGRAKQDGCRIEQREIRSDHEKDQLLLTEMQHWSTQDINYKLLSQFLLGKKVPLISDFTTNQHSNFASVTILFLSASLIPINETTSCSNIVILFPHQTGYIDNLFKHNCFHKHIPALSLLINTFK